MQALLSMAKSVTSMQASAQPAPEPTSELLGRTFPIAKHSSLHKFMLIRQVPQWPTDAVPGEGAIMSLFDPQKRVSFKGTVIVEEKQKGAWVHDPMIHTAPVARDASLGVVDLPCALLARAEGSNAVAWLAAPPVPSGGAAADSVLHSHLETHFPIMLLSGAFSKDLQESTKLRLSRGIIIITPPNAPPASAAELPAWLAAIDQSACSAFAGPLCVRAAALPGGKFVLLNPTSTAALEILGLAGAKPGQSLNDLFVRLAKDGVSAFGHAIHDRATPRFLARQATGPCVLLSPADLVALAPQIDASAATIALFKDVLGQVDLGMTESDHRKLIAEIGKVVEAFVDAPRGPPIDLEQLQVQAGVAAKARLGESATAEQLEAGKRTEFTRMLRERAEAERGARTKRQKALGEVREMLAQRLCLGSLTTEGGNLKIQLKKTAMAANIAEADKLTPEHLGDLIDSECGEQGVLYVNMNPDMVLRRLQLAAQQKRDELRALPAPLAERKPEAFDASTGASLVVLAASKPHRLAAHTPGGAQLFMPAAMGQGSALVVPLFDRISKLPDPRKVNWLTLVDEKPIAMVRVLTSKAICSTCIGRDNNLTVDPKDPLVRFEQFTYYIGAAQDLSARLSGPVSFEDTTRAILRCLIGNAVLAVTSGATPLSLVFQLLAAPVRCDTPRGAEDWERYAAVAALIPHTGWDVNPSRMALIGIIVRAIDSKVRGFVKKAVAATVQPRDRYFAELIYASVCSGLSKRRHRKLSRMSGALRGTNLAAAILEVILPAWPGASALQICTTVDDLKNTLKSLLAVNPAMQGQLESAPGRLNPRLAPHPAIGGPAAAGGASNAEGQLSDCQMVKEELLRRGVTAADLRDMYTASHNLVRVAEANDEDAVNSVAELVGAPKAAFRSVCNSAGFGADLPAVRMTLARCTELLFALKEDNPPPAQEKAIEALSTGKLIALPALRAP